MINHSTNFIRKGDIATSFFLHYRKVLATLKCKGFSITQRKEVFIMKEKKKFLYIIIPSVIAIAIMYCVDNIICPDYFLKSLIKVILFGGCVVLFGVTCKENTLKENFHLKKKKSFLVCAVIALLTYGVILGGYALIKDFIDPEQITGNMFAKGNISKDNFLWVALYISAINSFLEEIFFRGFLFLQIKKQGYRKIAYSVSAFFFAIYHIGIVASWFNIWIFILIIFLLYIAGVILNKATESCDSFLGSWMIHIFANLGINTIGCYLLGIF